MESNNVIQFPGSYRETPPITPEDFDDRLKESKQNFVDEIVDFKVLPFLSDLDMMGFDINKKGFDVLYSLNIECMRAILYDNLGVRTPIMDSLEEFMKKLEKDEVLDFSDFSEDRERM